MTHINMPANNEVAGEKESTRGEHVDDMVCALSELQISKTEDDETKSNMKKSSSRSEELPGGPLSTLNKTSEKDSEDLTESSLDSDGESLGCESDLDSDGVTGKDDYRARRPRVSVQGGYVGMGPERIRLPNSRVQPYRASARTSQEDSLGSESPRVSTQDDAFLMNLISDESQNDIEQRSDFDRQVTEGSDVADLLRALENASAEGPPTEPSQTGGHDFVFDDAVCESYQTTIPLVVEEKVNEVEPEKKQRKKRGPGKKQPKRSTTSGLNSTKQGSVSGLTSSGDVTQDIRLEDALDFISDHLTNSKATQPKDGSPPTNSHFDQDMFVPHNEGNFFQNGHMPGQTDETLIYYREVATATSTVQHAGAPTRQDTPILNVNTEPTPFFPHVAPIQHTTIQQNQYPPGPVVYSQQTTLPVQEFVPQYTGSTDISTNV